MRNFIDLQYSYFLYIQYSPLSKASLVMGACETVGVQTRTKSTLQEISNKEKKLKGQVIQAAKVEGGGKGVSGVGAEASSVYKLL